MYPNELNLNVNLTAVNQISPLTSKITTAAVTLSIIHSDVFTSQSVSTVLQKN